MSSGSRISRASNWWMTCRKHVVGLLLALTLAGVILYASTDSNALTSMTLVYSFMVILPLVVAFMHSRQIAPFGGEPTSSAMFYGLSGTAMLIYGIVYMYAKYATGATKFFVNATISVAIVVGVAIGAVLIYAVFADRLRAMQDMRYGVLIRLIFYIPCLLNDLMTYLVGQYKITPTQVVLLFAAEMALLLSIYYLPRAASTLRADTSRVLLKDPVFIDTSTKIATSEDLLDSTADLDIPLPTEGGDMLTVQSSIPNETPYEVPKKRIARNYSLSFWTFINAQSASSPAYARECAILDYSYTDGRGKIYPKPRLTYDQTAGEYYLYVSSATDKYTIRTVDLPAQRWNNFVFNYADGVADVFINGTLERTFAMGAATPKYDVADLITLGADNGLFGAVCNVKFCYNVMSEGEIVGAYNTLRRLTPPVMSM
jgi:Concanavalin A-like lectin/glucanases superfamily